jgi:predicted AlkP superfamily pyrophosphatase or phosphodiesterase
MQSTLILNVVGMTPALLSHAPNLRALGKAGDVRPLVPVTPAVTTTVQASMLTGALPRDHGIVANGWYFRDLAEIWFWRQSNRLVQGEFVWDAARKRDPSFRSAQMFWWYNMYASADWTVTPRPMYPADGRKLPDVYTQPGALRNELNAALGTFPLFQFWGPGADISSSTWIARATLHVMRTRKPTMAFAYLPHLDYALQRLGPDHLQIAQEVAAVDALCGELISAARAEGRQITVVSEYGIMPVSRPVHINRALREHGFLEVREELGREQLDAGASRAFAVADHQLAHIYVRDAELIEQVTECVARLPGVARVLDAQGKREMGLDHARSGELIALAERDSWFTYYHFLDDSRAPDYARTVDIHRKPGYDPAELFLDPALRFPKLRIAARLSQKLLGMRYLMDVIPLDASLVKGSHGVATASEQHGPLVICSTPELLRGERVPAVEIKDLLLRQTFGDATLSSRSEALHEREGRAAV